MRLDAERRSWPADGFTNILPTMVTLVQPATNLPTFVLSLLGGALANVVDRKRFLPVTTIWMMVFAAILGVLHRRGNNQCFFSSSSSRLTLALLAFSGSQLSLDRFIRFEKLFH